VEMLPGENHRDRVLSEEEETRYLAGATAVGDQIQASYQHALEGIRATMRSEQPIKPEDPFLLRDVTTLLIDCGLRPDECFRLRWEHVREEAVHVPFGKTENARRTIPLTLRMAAVSGDAPRVSEDRMGVSCTNQKRAYRKIQSEEATRKGVQAGEGPRLCAVHIPSYLPDALGGLHGPLHSRLPGGSQ